MKFWLPVRAEGKGVSGETTDDPRRIADLISRGARITHGVFRLPNIGEGIKIKQSYESTNPEEIKALMQVGGILRFNPKDAIDEGLLSAAEVKALGFDVEVSDESEEEPKSKSKPADLPPKTPNLDTISKEALVSWADAQDPPIHLDRRKRKDALVKEVKMALAKR